MCNSVDDDGRRIPAVITTPAVLLLLLPVGELDGYLLAAGFGESPAGADALGWRAFIVVMLGMFTARGIVGNKKADRLVPVSFLRTA
ncbi:hypothetical protein [Arthrobacter sp. ISL-72]|uniref:hypothetical protein n=1 Tax=Arthrobacter sp. ISL-72 TaxID=2819114 RepID=UPI001BE927C2|nr:hypothetical protein [Arthrobacter sp. ISL-72]MBT2598004.1 hypothetical protein [Arthrobacter sp. ISL-72]